MNNFELNTISVNDVVHTLRECARDSKYEGMFEHMLTFASELTGISEDTLSSSMHENQKIESWEQLREKYPMYREDMEEDMEEQFVEDCFSLYEKEGFAPFYWSPHTDCLDYIGQQFEVVGRCAADENHDLSVLPMWKIKFSDGFIGEAYPEEIIPSEMRSNGCKLFITDDTHSFTEYGDLYTCLADKEYMFLVKAIDSDDALRTGEDWYTNTIFEPGHFSCWKTQPEDFPRLDLEEPIESKAYRNRNSEAMELRDFLAYFDFDYDVISPGGKTETHIREELLEDGDLSPDDVNKNLICLIDTQGAYFGDIGKMRYPISQNSVPKIIDRMDVYIQEFVNKFREALESRDIDTSNLSLGDMIAKCKALNIDDGEVCYTLAEAVNRPENIYIIEVQQLQKEQKKESLSDKIFVAEVRSRSVQPIDSGREPGYKQDR